MTRRKTADRLAYLNDALQPIEVQWEQVLLDPNNPRFFGEVHRDALIPEKHFDSLKVQQDTFAKLLDRFDVSDLRKSILKVGFLSVDRIVVRELAVRDKATKYVVIEGNRRMAAIHSIMTDYVDDKIEVPDEVIRSIERFGVLCLDKSVDFEQAQLMIQGIRHISGAKDWKPYQQSLLIDTLKKRKLEPREIGEAIGLSTRVVNQLDRARAAFEQMRADTDYGELATPDKFSFFIEMHGRPGLRDDWFKCDSAGKITKADRRRYFYQWISEHALDKDRKKLQDAKDLRKLEKIYQGDKDLFQRFLTDERLDIDEAIARFEYQPPNWIRRIEDATEALGDITAREMKKMPRAKLVKLKSLYKELEARLHELGEL